MTRIMSTETIRHMDRNELVEWLDTKGQVVDPEASDDDLRDEVCIVLASECCDEDPPDPWRE